MPETELKKEYRIERLPQKIVVSLWLDDYDNLFSDFDPRSFSRRVISDDFLHEAQKIIPEGLHEPLQLTLLVPHSKRDIASEKIIISRLHGVFVKNYQHFEKEAKKIIRMGFQTLLLGTILIFGATLVSHVEENSLVYTFLRVLLEPSGWFVSWYGLDHIFYISQENKHLQAFYKNLEKAEIAFDVY